MAATRSNNCRINYFSWYYNTICSSVLIKSEAVAIPIQFRLPAAMWDISGLAAAILDFWLPLTSHSVRLAVFEFLILENMGIAVWILILSQLPPEICDSSGLSAAIFNLRLKFLYFCMHIRSASWDTCSTKSINIRTVDFCPILVFYMTLKL